MFRRGGGGGLLVLRGVLKRGPRFVLSVLIPCTTSWGWGTESEVWPSFLRFCSHAM